MKIIMIMMLLMSQLVYSNVTFQWIGVSGFALSDNKTTLIFDPAMTSVGFLKYLPWGEIESDKENVAFWMKKCEIKKVDAVIINHSHTDHIIDMPTIIKNYGGDLYGSESALNYARGMDIESAKLHKVTDGFEFEVGEFKIKAIETPHPPHFMGIMLGDGKIESPLKTPVHPLSFKVGKTYSYFMTHKNLKILFSAVSVIHEPDALKNVKADVLLATIVKRGDTTNFVNKRVLTSKAKMVIPLHYDNFFKKLNREGPPQLIAGVRLEEFIDISETLGKPLKVHTPQYCEKLGLK